MKRYAPLLLLLAAVACRPPSAEDLVREVVAIRNNYEAELGSWIIREDGPQPWLVLDVSIINNNQEEALRTLTVMVEQRDIDNNVLVAQRVAIDVAALTAGIGRSVSVEVRPVHPEVDGLFLYVERSPERDTWREFPELDAVRPRI